MSFEQFQHDGRDSPPVVEHNFRSWGGGCLIVVCLLAGVTYAVASRVPQQFSIPTLKAGIATAIAIMTLWLARVTVGYSLSMFWHWMRGTPIKAVCVRVRLLKDCDAYMPPQYSGWYEYDYSGVRYRIRELDQGFAKISTGDVFVVYHLPGSASPGMRVRVGPMLWRFVCGSIFVIVGASIACLVFSSALADFQRLLEV